MTFLLFTSCSEHLICLVSTLTFYSGIRKIKSRFFFLNANIHNIVKFFWSPCKDTEKWMILFFFIFVFITQISNSKISNGLLPHENLMMIFIQCKLLGRSEMPHILDGVMKFSEFITLLKFILNVKVSNLYKET